MVKYDPEALTHIIQSSYRFIRQVEAKQISKTEAINKMVSVVEKEVKGVETKNDNK